MGKYAKETTVPIDRTQASLKRVVARYGGTHFGYIETPGSGAVAFQINDRQVRFVVPLPDREHGEFTHTPTGILRAPATANSEWEKACRQRWRALELVVKAKLEAVESGIVEFEREFFAHLVLPDGRTVWEHVGADAILQIESGAPARLSLEA